MVGTGIVGQAAYGAALIISQVSYNSFSEAMEKFCSQAVTSYLVQQVDYLAEIVYPNRR